MKKHEVRNRSERGSAIVAVVVMTSAMAVMSLILLTSLSSSSRERRSASEQMNLTYLCEAGLAEAAANIRIGGSGNMGDEQNPVAYGSGSYWVSTANADGVYTLTSTGTEGRDRTTLELALEWDAGSFFQWAAFGETGVTMDSNAMTDSYDSSRGLYSDQDVNGSGQGRWASENGHVGTNQDVLIESNSVIHGSAIPGPTGTADAIGNADITGLRTPASSLVVLDPVVVPSIPSTGVYQFSGSQRQPAGDYHWDELLLDSNAKLHLTGPSTIVVGDMSLSSNAKITIDATNGPVEFYVENDFILDSNTRIASTTFNPLDVSFFLTSDNIQDPNAPIALDTIKLDSNASLYGTIYAPEASINVDSNFELYGSLVARRVHLDSNSRIHFDENLLNAGNNANPSLQALCWRVVGTP